LFYENSEESMRDRSNRFKSLSALILVFSAAGTVARADVIHDETVNADLSGNYLAPSPFALPYGTSSIVFTSGVDDLGNVDLDLVRVDMPAGGLLTSVTLTDYLNPGGRSFIALQGGAVFTFDPDQNTGDPSECQPECLGFTHFGPTELGGGEAPSAALGDNLLIALNYNGEFFFQGFDIPLPDSQYVFWLQDNSAFEQYTIDFVVSIPGDYNGDSFVNAADYTTWRNTLGQNVNIGEGADGDRDGMIDRDDYLIWKETYGMVVGGGGASVGVDANVPEPSTALLIAIAAVSFTGALRRRG
jgi:hypothetical protein